MQPLRVKSSTEDLEAAIHRLKRSRIRQILDGRRFQTAYQPLFRLSDNRIEGLECLTRFWAEPQRSPDEWFLEAADVGLGLELELVTFQAALRALNALPDVGYLALNASPEAIVSERIAPLLARIDPRRIVLEVTEHARVEDYPRLNRSLARLRADGVRLAVDDVGAGYASMRHILSLKPDLIKLDISLTQDIDACPARAALTQGLIHFARTIGCGVVAEGVETPAQLVTLRKLGVDVAQGYLLGRPICCGPQPRAA